MNEHVATIIIAVGYNYKTEPGFGAIDIETGEIFVHYGRVLRYEQKRELLDTWHAWKRKVGPKIEEVEMKGGFVNSFMHHNLDLPSTVVGLDLESYYQGVMGERIEYFAQCAFDHGTIEERLGRMHKLYVLLKKIRTHIQDVLERANVLASIQAEVAQLTPSKEERNKR
ncbi:MAG: hypothetical protein KGI59_00175 [Patescibacteria group bacterium]|nr:hypothetical protein [Patescibacteria group bacterium]MDE2172514.1 hypothetical protein [Patescibacteria group bacterium]